ncbi:PAC2 family protein [Alloscardovia theropitheci]|uniref:PAC2 family protein n=1 Tax=Alloscardovia theropitheci TaxID=2496842 RepID=A0A4R0QYN4_9BIFI|nr:PAC2 family protein [Alloscardovia theropitheci]TCD54771.1 PAC2 family protein [Alloscardovia theropitheci]
MSEFEEIFTNEGIPATPHRTVMLCAFEGWNDASQVSTQTLKHLINVYSEKSREVNHICCGSFYDYTVTRPVILNVDGKRKIMWPENTFTEIEVSDSLTLLIQIGPEPNFRWTEFTQQTMAIAEEREVDEIITIGSMFADCTHTRPLPVYFNDVSDNTATDHSYEGPIGITSMINYSAVEYGFPTRALWISLPSYAQYIDSQDNPMAILRVLDELSRYIGEPLEVGSLPVLSLKWQTKADMVASINSEITDYISTMEKYYDNQEKINAFSPDAASELITETEKFLRGFADK